MRPFWTKQPPRLSRPKYDICSFEDLIPYRAYAAISYAQRKFKNSKALMGFLASKGSYVVA